MADWNVTLMCMTWMLDGSCCSGEEAASIRMDGIYESGFISYFVDWYCAWAYEIGQVKLFNK